MVYCVCVRVCGQVCRWRNAWHTARIAWDRSTQQDMRNQLPFFNTLGNTGLRKARRCTQKIRALCASSAPCVRLATRPFGTAALRKLAKGIKYTPVRVSACVCARHVNDQIRQ